MCKAFVFAPMYLVCMIFITHSTLAAPPTWASRNTQYISGKIYRVVCSGSGPSIGFARQNALDSCKVSAAQQLMNDITVKSMSVSSERQVAFQQEVLNRSHVSGLSCNPRREEIDESGEEVHLWLLCDFDLSKARKTHVTERTETYPELSDWIQPKVRPHYFSDERKVLTLAVIPSCSEMIIRGAGPGRIVACEQNPVSVILEPFDREIILRAKNYLPKSIFLGPHRESHGYVQVVLQPNP